jgi:hypothetical protein
MSEVNLDFANDADDPGVPVEFCELGAAFRVGRGVAPAMETPCDSASVSGVGVPLYVLGVELNY